MIKIPATVPTTISIVCISKTGEITVWQRLIMSLYISLPFWGAGACFAAARSCCKKDYRFLIPVIKILNQPKYDGLCDVDLTDADLDKSWYVATVMELIDELKKYFMSQTYYKIQKNKNSNAANNVGYSIKDVHDTVIGKILLATLGCIPAYDQYVVVGMKAEGLCGALGKRSLSGLVDYSHTHAGILQKIKASVNVDLQRESGCSTLIYPVAKILDMIFFRIWV